MKIPIFTISLLLSLPSPQGRGQTVDPVNPGRGAPPVDPARVPSSASVEVETDAAQNPAPSTTKPRGKKLVTDETPATVVVKPKNPFSGFRHVDRDEDGTISLKELTVAFRRADSDFDGQLSLEEFQRDIVNQPLDAGGQPDPPQIIVVPPKEQQDADATEAALPNRNVRGRTEPNRRQTPNNAATTATTALEDEFDENDLDDVDFDQGAASGTTRRNRPTDNAARDPQNVDTDADDIRSERADTNNPNATPNSPRDNPSAASRNRSRTATERTGPTSNGTATRPSSGSSTRPTRPASSTSGSRRSGSSTGSGTSGAGAGSTGGTSGGSAGGGTGSPR